MQYGSRKKIARLMRIVVIQFLNTPVEEVNCILPKKITIC